MSRPRWITAAGNLGTIPELDFKTVDLKVTTDSSGGNTPDPTITFSFLSGQLPPGMQVIRSGRLQGVPVILDPIEVDESREYRFTIRATATDNTVVDRSFSLTITNVFPPTIVPRISYLGNYLDGTYFEKQLRAIEDNPNAVLKWRVAGGQLPNGITLTENGLLSGYIQPEADDQSTLIGYDSYDPDNKSRKNYYDLNPFDTLGRSRNRNYTFTLEVTDGGNTDTLTYNIGVASKALFRADQDHYLPDDNLPETISENTQEQTLPRGKLVIYQGTIYVVTQTFTFTAALTPDKYPSYYREYDIQKIAITVDNDYLTVDHDELYLPIITTPPQALPTLRQENNFAYKFDAIDFDNNQSEIFWEIKTSGITGFDSGASFDLAVTPETLSEDIYVFMESTGSTTTFLLTGTEIWQTEKTYSANTIVSFLGILYVVKNNVTSVPEKTPEVDSTNYEIYNSQTVAINAESNYPEGSTFDVFGIYEPDGSDPNKDPDLLPLVEGVDYSVNGAGTQISFVAPLPAGKYYAGLRVTKTRPGVVTGLGFDSGELVTMDLNRPRYDRIIDPDSASLLAGGIFDEGESQLPPGLVIDNTTGWLYGYLPAQQEESKTYNFTIRAYNVVTSLVDDITVTNRYYSKPVEYTLTVLGSLTDRIVWKTPEDLGSIVNGSISELKVEAISELGQDIRYSLVGGERNRFPQALSLDLLDDGLISGRTTFRYFQLDKDGTTFDKKKTFFDTNFTFTVKAETSNIMRVYKSSRMFSSSTTATETIDIDGVNSGQVTWKATKESNSVFIAYSGNRSMLGREISGPGISDGSTIIEQIRRTDDNGAVYTELRLDKLLSSTVDENSLVHVMDGVISSIRTFKLRVDVVHEKPFENLYFKAFPTLKQRQDFFEIINDQSIFPDELIYRPTDPWFGKSNTIKFLALAGINASSLEDYIEAMEENHFWKQVNFGEIKTAVAVDEFYNTKYEVVYIEVIDPTNLSEIAIKEKVTLLNNPYVDLYGISHTEIYPNTFANMSNNITGSLGYRARGVFPDWMTSVQPDKSVIGFKRAVVLAYTVPGAADLIAYRLKNKNISFNNIEFTIDRYQLDSALSDNFDTNTQEFISSQETTFDRLPLGPGELNGGIVNYAVVQPFSSIHNRTVNYIKSIGGIDGVKNFRDGDLLVFAKQEDFGSSAGPNDGWIDYQNLYVGDIPDNSDFGGVPNPNDSGSIDEVYGFDSYRVIPSIRNKGLTVKRYLVKTNSSAGSTKIFIPYTIGVSYAGKIIEGFGIPYNTKVESHREVDIGTTNPDLVTELTLSQPITANVNIGNNVTIKSAVFTIGASNNYSLRIESMPQESLIGMRLSGPGIPAGTIVTSVNSAEKTLTTNNLMVDVPAGSVIGYEIVNQRGGIWKINISDDQFVTLEFIKEIKLGESVKIQSGYTNGFTVMIYDYITGYDAVLPAYRRWTEQIQDSSKSTVWDGNGTRFFDRRDTYLKPESDDKYLKFPQIGVFK